MSQGTPSKEGRIERHLMRQRGAGVRSVTADFGFSFAPTIVPKASIEPPTKRRRVAQDGENSATADRIVENLARKEIPTASLAGASDAGLASPATQEDSKAASLDRMGRIAGTGVSSKPQRSATANQEGGSLEHSRAGYGARMVDGDRRKEKPQACGKKVRSARSRASQAAKTQENPTGRGHEAGENEHNLQQSKGSAAEDRVKPAQPREIAVTAKDCDDENPNKKPTRSRKKATKGDTRSRAAEASLDEVEDSFVAGLKPRKDRKVAKKDQEETAAADGVSKPTSEGAPMPDRTKQDKAVVGREEPTKVPSPEPAPQPEPSKKRGVRKRKVPDASEPVVKEAPPSCRPKRQAAASATEKVSRGYDQEASSVDKLRREPEIVPALAKSTSKGRKCKISPVNEAPMPVVENQTPDNAPELEGAPEPEDEKSAVATLPMKKTQATRSRKTWPARANGIEVSAALGAILGLDVVDNEVSDDDNEPPIRSAGSAPKAISKRDSKRAFSDHEGTDGTATTTKRRTVRASRARTTSASTKRTTRAKKAPEPVYNYVEPTTKILETQEVPVLEEPVAEPNKTTGTARKERATKSKKPKPDYLRAEAEDNSPRVGKPPPSSEDDHPAKSPQDDARQSSNDTLTRPPGKRKRESSALGASAESAANDGPPSKAIKVAVKARGQSREVGTSAKSRTRPALAQTDVNISRPSTSPEKLEKPDKLSSLKRTKEAHAVAKTDIQSKTGSSSGKPLGRDAGVSPTGVNVTEGTSVGTHSESTTQPARATKGRRRIAKDEDIDWLFAASEPKRPRAAAKAAPKSRSGTAVRRGCKDMDLDDLLDNIAAFSG